METAKHTWIAPADSAVFATVAPEVADAWLADEAATVRALVELADIGAEATSAILEHSRRLVGEMRTRSDDRSGIDAFMREYDLSSREGILLMCLAEALLRIPDAETADRLIADKLGDADFHEHLSPRGDLFVNVSTWGLLLSGRVVGYDALAALEGENLIGRLVSRLGEPVVRSALRMAMRLMGDHFVIGHTIEQALKRAARSPEYRYSFDMLGEAALSEADADLYFDRYMHAIEVVAEAGPAASKRPAGVDRRETAEAADVAGVSVKLSALSPRFEHAQSDALELDLIPRLNALARRACKAGVQLTVDAEEAERLEPTLRAFATVYRKLAAQSGCRLGLAVQAYQKRGLPVIGWLERLARENGRAIPVRLVKGAYWDTEIKLAQLRGLAGYPVFTRKSSTDVSYLACARALLEAAPSLYPQFATHNPHTVAWVLNRGRGREFEFQRLYGMGEELYESLAALEESPRPCRVYAPVGEHRSLLPYLVRRLLENGANTSFVNRFADAKLAVDELIADPVAETRALGDRIVHPRIPLPMNLYGEARRNSAGVNLADPIAVRRLSDELSTSAARERSAVPIAGGRTIAGDATASYDPSRRDTAVGRVEVASAGTARLALEAAAERFPTWNLTAAAERAAVLERTADLLESRMAELITIAVTEAGRTVPDAVAEVREAVDFLRYYAREGRALYGETVALDGPTGERNVLSQTGRGPFLCISPWNFPIAIFTGQIAAALVAGNTVIAKPAEQTPLTAAGVVRIFREAGLPDGVLQFLPGSGPEIGGALLPDPRLAGVAFTGSYETAKIIERALAARDGPIAALIAETGGVNAMIVDSSALTEQVVRDAVTSAFNSAGQRCSALRLLILQEDSADEVIEMLIGRMREIVIGDPAEMATDVGPVIDAEARESLMAYLDEVDERVLYQCRLPERHGCGWFVPPTLIRLDAVGDLTREIFGPVLHIVRYDPERIDEIVDTLNGVGYGLTLGIQSRIDSFAERIVARCRVGNIYVNRDMIGAVVGVQPFGGFGLSGTGPKAGGPQYLQRFGVEKSIATNTAAIGGNATLLGLGEL